MEEITPTTLHLLVDVKWSSFPVVRRGGGAILPDFPPSHCNLLCLCQSLESCWRKERLRRTCHHKHLPTHCSQDPTLHILKSAFLNEVTTSCPTFSPKCFLMVPPPQSFPPTDIILSQLDCFLRTEIKQ